MKQVKNDTIIGEFDLEIWFSLWPKYRNLQPVYTKVHFNDTISSIKRIKYNL